jgi:CO dehydrogenase maturation factor
MDLLNKQISFRDTVSGRVTEIARKLIRDEIPPHLSEKSLVEQEVLRNIIKFENFDAIVQGRREGEGCYCTINNILKNLINVLAQIYNIIIIDSPAGLEFFARKTSKNVDDLILVIDPSKMSFHTLQRIMEIEEEVSLDFNNIWVLGNRFTDGIKNLYIEKLKKSIGTDLRILGFLSYSKEIQRFNLNNNSLLNIPRSNSVYQKAIKIFSKIM